MLVPLEHLLLFSGILFALGFFGLLVRRNLIFVFLSIEVMLNAAAFAFVSASSYFQHATGQVMFIIIVSMAAAEVAVGLALVLQYEKRFKTLDIDAAHQMKG